MPVLAAPGVRLVTSAGGAVTVSVPATTVAVTLWFEVPLVDAAAERPGTTAAAIAATVTQASAMARRLRGPSLIVMTFLSVGWAAGPSLSTPRRGARDATVTGGSIQFSVGAARC